MLESVREIHGRLN